MKEKESAVGAAVMEQVAGSSSRKAGKYLTFKLANEEYGLEILKVREIIGLMDITKVPRTPDNIRGVINLRGKVIPVMDLRVKFLMEETEDTNETCIIVVDVARGDRSVLMGTLVDSVSEVLDIAAEEIEDAPSFGTNVNTDFILGMGKTRDKVIILLDIDEVMASEDLSTFET
ncbi:chemotaxis protein CheW, partial [Gemmatimonadota bacterium]